MVEQLIVRPSGSSDTLRRQPSYNKNYIKRVQPYRVNLRRLPHNEDFLLIDYANIIVVGSRMLWNAVFHTPNRDGRYKQISKELGGGRSKQIYSAFAEVYAGHALLLFFALIKDSQRATYDRCTFHYNKCIYQRRDAVGIGPRRRAMLSLAHTFPEARSIAFSGTASL
uniref:Uncharacterized protein n=1 Tax=Heterorhabditis bacteriophora TaxID=37862 RepID=A0A1I7XSN8_HETBA